MSVASALLVSAVAPVLFAWSAAPSHARELALVVGIDDYRHGDAIGAAGAVRNLEGAENDARLLVDTLRGIGADLPDRRVLTGERATADAFRRAWADVLADARPGDGIVVTFAGHGGREREFGAPEDEDDGYDETLMFWDFDPEHPTVGRVPDDELFAMFEAADTHRITFVADSCHSGGLTREVDRQLGRSRQGGTWNIPGEDAAMPASVPVAAENWESLRHVTYLTATADESKVIREIRHESVPHGALSVSFAAGILGEADSDGDGYVVRHELQDYVGYRVATLSSRTQTPGFLPRGTANDDAPLLRIGDGIGASDADDAEALEISVVGGAAPSDLTGVRVVDGAALQFEVRADEVVVHHGTDEIARLVGSDAREASAWRTVVDKFRLLDAIDASYDRASGPLDIALDCPGGRGCDARHPRGTALTLRVDEPSAGGHHFVLFNIAGSGELQPLYPDAGFDDPSVPARLPYALEVHVVPPYGRDDAVAGFCRRDPLRLKSLLETRGGGPVPPAARFVELSGRYGCQWGRYPLFTGPRP